MEKFSPKNLVVINPSEYFNALISGALENLQVQVSDHAKFYLVNLLAHFISTENLFPRNEEGKAEDYILALKLAEALNVHNDQERRARLKQLGDTSLYIAGYFSESLQGKMVDIDYYIDMGGSAYLEAANIPSKHIPGEVFTELGKKFPRIVEVLGQISEESFVNQYAKQNSNKSLLKLYGEWARTGSERIEKQLASAGIITTEKKIKKEKKQ